MNESQISKERLVVQNLTTRFNITEGLLNRTIARVHAVESVSFGIKSGETLSLVGESGCGKTTTGRTILGLEKADSGNVSFEGKQIQDLNSGDRQGLAKKIQMIFQDPYASLNPRISVQDAIAEPLRVHNIAQGSDANDMVGELLKRVQLSPNLATRYPHEFSGGQRQRISIARALAVNPKMVICDEAVSALDVTIKAQVINLLMDLQNELGLSYLFISHDMAVVERISHRVAVMYLGQIVEIGSREQVFENPVHSYTKKLLSAVPVADPRLSRSDRVLSPDEIPSPIKPVNYEPTLVTYKEVDSGHFVANEQ